MEESYTMMYTILYIYTSESLLRASRGALECHVLVALARRSVCVRHMRGEIFML